MRSKPFKRLLITALCFIMLFSVCACNSGSDAGTASSSTAASGSTAGSKTPQKDTLTVILSSDIENFCPGGGTSFPHVQTMRQVFESLVVRDKNMKLQPWLADSWEWKDDITLVFHLHKGIKFTDGTELKSGDVLFTIQYIQDSKNGGIDYVRQIDLTKSSAPDDYTVQLALKQPTPNQVELLESPEVGIMSEKATKAGEKFTTADSAVGTGPYIATEYKAGDSLKMSANPNYWNKNAAPKIPNILFRFVADPSSRSIEAESGTADIVYDIPAADAGRLKANKNINYVSALGANTCYLCFNVLHKPLDDDRVRRAIWYAIDRSATVKSAYKDFGAVADGMFSPDLDGRHPDLSKYFMSHDVEKAKSLLAEAGYPNGGLKLTYIVGSSSQDRKDMGEAIQAQLAEIGIQLEVKTVAGTGAFQAVLNGQHDLCIWGFTATTFEVGRNLIRWIPGSTDFNIFGWTNDGYIALINKAMSTLDTQKRYQMFNQAQEMLMESHIALPLWSKELAVVLQPNVKGFFLMRTFEQHYLQYVYFG